MFATAVLSFVLLNVAVSTLGQEDQDCLPPHEGGPHMHGEHDCCSAPTVFGTEDVHKKMHECMEQNGMKKPERGSGPPAKPDENTIDCMDQCMWKSVGLLGEDGAMNKAAMTAKLTEVYTGVWAPVATAALEKCFENAASKVSETSTCKSGSRQFMQCFTREMFLNCPKENWTESDQCTQIQQIFKKCENKPAMSILHGRPRHGPPHHH